MDETRVNRLRSCTMATSMTLAFRNCGIFLARRQLIAQYRVASVRGLTQSSPAERAGGTYAATYQELVMLTSIRGLRVATLAAASFLSSNQVFALRPRRARATARYSLVRLRTCEMSSRSALAPSFGRRSSRSPSTPDPFASPSPFTLAAPACQRSTGQHILMASTPPA